MGGAVIDQQRSRTHDGSQVIISRIYNSNRPAYLAVTGALLALLSFFVLALTSPGRLHFEMANDNGDRGQIYVDSGRGYAPQNVVTLSLISNGELHQYDVDVATSLPDAIRLDIGESAGSVRLGQIRFDTLLYTQTVSCEDLRLVHAVERRSMTGDACELRAIADDPYVDFAVASRSIFRGLHIKWREVLAGLAYALLTSLLVFATCRVRNSDVALPARWLLNERAARWYAMLAIGFVSFVFLNLHVSSMGQWKYVLSPEVPSGVLLGEPRPIRSDEWAVQTPFYASQAAFDFGLHNPSLGADRVALAASVPVRGLYGYVQPRFWGFYLLGFEKGFSWLYAWRVFGLLFALFVLSSLITKGDFWLAMMGSVWATLSPFMQWWFTTNLPDMVIGFAAGIVAFYLLLSASSLVPAIGASLVLFFAGITFLTALYPAFLVPLFYLALFVLVGLTLRDRLYRNFLINWPIKVFLLIVPIAAVVWIMLDWMKEASSPISLLQNSAYPGQRVSLGGNFSVAHLFSGYFSPFLSNDSFPRILGNVCEASNFLLFFPVAWLVLAAKYRRSGRINPLDFALSLYIVFILLWIIVGYPSWLAISSGLSMSPSKRTVLGVGLASILLMMSVSSMTVENARGAINRAKVRSAIPLLVALLAGFALISLFLANAFPDFVTWWRIAILVPTLAFWSLAFIQGRRYWLVALTGLLVLNGLFVNPIARGIAPLHDARLESVLSKDEELNGTKWLAFSNFLVPQYLKAHGATVWNGTRFISDPVEMRVLDPDERYREIWYRYAHFIVEAAPSGSSAKFELKQTDVVLLKVDICSDAIHALGVNRFAFMAKPDPGEISCLRPMRAAPVAGLWLYKRRNNQLMLEKNDELEHD